MSPAHRRTKSSGPPPPSQTLVVDNGAYTIKAGFSSLNSASEPRIIPNCMARDRDKKVYIGSQLEKCKDFGDIAFRRPVEKGYLVNWEAEKEIWEHEFFDEKAPLHCDPRETGLLLAEAPNALPALQTNCDQIVFEEFGFARYYRCPSLNAYNDIQATFKGPARDDSNGLLPAEIVLLIDCGYSHTTITPLLQGRPLQSAIRRLDVGGKLMTNYLTRLLSLRQYDMRNDTYLVNEIKEACSYVTKDFKGDMEKTWKGTKGERREAFLTGGGIAKDYVLPDYHNRSKGYVRDHDPSMTGKLRKLAATGKPIEAAEDILTLRNERFTVPELLFNPSDIGMRQSGIAQLVMESLSCLPMGLWPGLLANIIVVGGSAKIEGFIWRLQLEIKALAPTECIVRVARPADPIISTWLGGAALAKDEALWTFPSAYGAVAVDWIGLDGWSGVQNVPGYTPDASSITTIIDESSGGCIANSFCSYACPAGHEKSQWPTAQGSNGQTVGGLYCNSNGFLVLPQPETTQICTAGTGSVTITNQLSTNVAICRTDYPGTEVMDIPLDTQAGQSYPLTVPPAPYFYFDGSTTSATYYVNSPGVPVSSACEWGSSETSTGNWAPVNIGLGQTVSGTSYLALFPNAENQNAVLDLHIQISGAVSSNCQYLAGIFTTNGVETSSGCTVALSGAANIILSSG
ncbi:hypothetical protein B7494_g7346 [Chlorociboria aeruginascens]|nr:hypothetical protein B7494_g7346 [Chlorociboria aeruginascens]